MKVAVLGLGASLGLFRSEEFDLSIGVNDIWRFVNSDVVVCLDPPKAFTNDRWKYIDSCKPKAFYSQIVNYDVRPDFVKIELQPGYPESVCNIDSRMLAKSFCSPFVAVQIAFKYYQAVEIHLFGVDLVNHPNLDSTLCRKIKNHFQNLKNALKTKNCQIIVHGEGILKDLV